MSDSVRLAVCVVCIHLLANGEYNDGTDAAERAGRGMAHRWAGYRLVPGSEELGFSTSACDGCGDSDHGDRHEAFASEIKMWS